MSATLFTTEDQRVCFEVRVQPRASKTEVAGEYGSAIKIRLQAPPVDGRANEALIAFLAETLGIAARAVEIVSGHTGRTKRIAIEGLTVEQVRQRLL
jgi:uncharacterized protein (TIGR00251 family)